MVFPADLALASRCSFAIGNSRCSRISIIASPTAPVAPTTATFFASISVSFFQSFQNGRRDFGGADAALAVMCSRRVNVGCPQPRFEHTEHGAFDGPGRIRGVERVTEHHRD